MSAKTLGHISFGLAAFDLWLAVFCASTGDANFIAFMLLAGMMYGCGLYWKAKARKEQEKQNG